MRARAAFSVEFEFDTDEAGWLGDIEAADHARICAEHCVASLQDFAGTEYARHSRLRVRELQGMTDR